MIMYDKAKQELQDEIEDIEERNTVLQEPSSVDSTFIINRLGPNQSVLKENLDIVKLNIKKHSCAKKHRGISSITF